MSQFSDTLGEASRGVDERARQFREGYSGVQDNLGHASDDLGEFVRVNPGRAVLIAAGCGFAIGLLMRTFDDDE